MGKFVTALEVKEFVRSDRVRNMDAELLDKTLIAAAEAQLEQAFALELETSRVGAEILSYVPRPIPCRLRSLFDQRPTLEDEFKKDCKTAVLVLLQRMEGNPDQLLSESAGSSSVTYGGRMPSEVRALMERWRGPRRLGRC